MTKILLFRPAGRVGAVCCGTCSAVMEDGRGAVVELSAGMFPKDNNGSGPLSTKNFTLQ